MLWGNVGGVNIPYILIEVFTPLTSRQKISYNVNIKLNLKKINENKCKHSV